GLPISILEALRAGLPVVASNVGGVSECVIDGETGFLVKQSNVDLLRGCLQRLTIEPSLRAKMGNAGRRLFEEKFTINRMIRDVNSVYESILRESYGYN